VSFCDWKNLTEQCFIAPYETSTLQEHLSEGQVHDLGGHFMTDV